MDVLDRTPPVADRRIAYGRDASQFGDLWMPVGRGPHPAAVFLHGGWWRAEYDLAYGGHLCAALKQIGVAVWSVEYRRVGKWRRVAGDVFGCRSRVEWLGRLAKEYPLDLTRVVGVGHSAGAHLAFWLAGRHHVPHTSDLEGLRRGG